MSPVISGQIGGYDLKKYLYLLCLLCLFSASGCGADQKDTSDPIPNVLAMDDLSDAQASALLLGYSMGEAHTEMQTSPAWQGTYDEERTLVLTENRGKTASRSLSKHLPLPSIESTCPKERSLMMAPGCLMTLSLHACIGPRTAPGLVFALQLNRENIFTKSNYNGRTQRLQPRMA